MKKFTPTYEEMMQLSAQSTLNHPFYESTQPRDFGTYKLRLIRYSSIIRGRVLLVSDAEFIVGDIEVVSTGSGSTYKATSYGLQALQYFGKTDTFGLAGFPKIFDDLETAVNAIIVIVESELAIKLEQLR